MPMATPEERAAIDVRLADLKTRMSELDRVRKPDYLAEWNALDFVRKDLERLLEDHE